MAKAVKSEALDLYCKLQANFNVVIEKSTLGGRGLFATEFIKKGSLIFFNKPTAYGPRANCNVKKFCSKCFKISDLCYPCEKCYAFVCSEICNISSDHNQLCSFIHDNWKLRNSFLSVIDIATKLARAIIYLRFLVLAKEEKDLIKVFQRTEIKSNFEELESLKSAYFIPEHHIKFINSIESIIKVNSFRISHNPIRKTVELRGLYPLSAFMNHSCIPNTRNSFDADYSMAVYASKDIEKGEEITSCYTGLLWCSPARRYQLYKSKKFWCKCARCNDKTEMGTKLSALNCLNKSCIGILLPKIPLDPQTVWVCDACNIIIPPEKINVIQSVLGSLFGTLRLDDEFQMDNVILQRLAIFVPYSNHIFVDIRLRLALKIGFTDDVNIKGINKRTH